ncbi:PREDICTED: uncharacterized protein LOC109171676 [Ipomoea nil]|uniref:uncharacterized protein LOC109171676 n=1 Tax=Ipomoea nil TaxID=35883 RepID=UPI000900C56D|nr:PREDICTED: uncharacterized protein LOC109171676 [Ipomoea nil]
MEVEKCEEISQGSFQPNRQNDILTSALGTNEYGGYVRGVGVHAKIRDVFGKPDSISRGKSVGVVSVSDLEEIVEKKIYEKVAEKIRKQTMEDMQSKLEIMQSQLENMIKNAQAIPKVGTPIRSSCHSIDPLNNVQENPKQTTMMNFESGDQSTVELRPLLVDDDTLQHLGDESKKLARHLKYLPSNLDYIDVDLEKAIFHHSHVEFIHVLFEDIKDMFTIQWLDMSSSDVQQNWSDDNWISLSKDYF